MPMDPKVSNNITPILLLGPDGRAAKKRKKIIKKKRNRTKRNNYKNSLLA